MKLFSSCQKGRSMIEMLGVLAIVGVLSVGGIAGYSKAMTKYRLNRLTEEYIQFINDILRYQKDFRQEQIRQGTRLFFAKYLAAAKLLPERWRVSGNSVSDSMENRLVPFIAETHKRMCVDLSLKNNNEAKANVEACRNLIINVVQHYQDVIYSFGVYRTGYGFSETIYGTTTCKKDRMCLSNITISDIQKLCETCEADAGCSLSINFTI